MQKKFLLTVAVLLLGVTLGAGCSKGGSQNQKNTKVEVPADTSDRTFSDPNTKVTFSYGYYLNKDQSSSEPGNVSVTFKKNPNVPDGLIDTLYFSTKTKDAWAAEKAKADPKKVCESNTQPGCEKWDDDYALYQKAITTGNYDGYYGFGGNKVTVNGITFVTIVSYNLDRKQYQTMYTGYSNNTRITFVDPATGGLEYGQPFSMDAKNRELVEKTGAALAKRQKVDDEKTRARADQLYQIVSTVKLGK